MDHQFDIGRLPDLAVNRSGYEGLFMNDITVSLPNDRIKELKEKSSRLGLTLEQLVLLSIEDILSRPDEEFRQVMDYVLQKNAKLYQRLA